MMKFSKHHDSHDQKAGLDIASRFQQPYKVAPPTVSCWRLSLCDDVLKIAIPFLTVTQMSVVRHFNRWLVLRKAAKKPTEFPVTHASPVALRSRHVASCWIAQGS